MMKHHWLMSDLLKSDTFCFVKNAEDEFPRNEGKYIGGWQL
jgi:hypothetical protein